MIFGGPKAREHRRLVINSALQKQPDPIGDVLRRLRENPPVRSNRGPCGGCGVPL